MSDSAHPRKRWIDAWLHSDLIGFPVTLAAVAIAAISFGLFVVIGGAGGLFVGKLLFVFGLGGLVGLILLLEGRRWETTKGVAAAAPASDGRERVLVVANEGLESAALCEEVCARGNGGGAETMIVAPVVASSALRALADDVDGELHEAQDRVDVAIEVLRRAWVDATGHVDVGDPMRCLIDGLREFRATEVLMIEGGEHRWSARIGLPSAFAPRCRSLSRRSPPATARTRQHARASAAFHRPLVAWGQCAGRRCDDRAMVVSHLHFDSVGLVEHEDLHPERRGLGLQGPHAQPITVAVQRDSSAR